MYRRLAAVLSCVVVLSCGGESGPNGIDIGSIVVTPNPVALSQQASAQLQVAVLDDAGALLTGVPVTFESGSTALVTVSNTGLVVSVGPAGASTITVRAGDIPVEVPVTVAATGNTVRILPSPAVVAQLQTLQLDVALLDLVGSVVPGTSFTYASSNESIATVGATGLVRSIGPSGQVTITATTAGLPTGNLSAQVQLAVTAMPASLELLPNPITMGRNSSLSLGARVLDAFGAPMADAQISFSASPASLLSVTPAGRLTGLGTAGAGTVTATSGTLSVSVPVTLIDVGSLAGTIVATATATPSPYGVVLNPAGQVFGVAIGGRVDVGTFGNTGIQSHSVSVEVTIGIDVHPTSGKLYVAGLGADALMEIDPVSGAVLRRWGSPVGEQMFDVAVSPDGQYVYVGGNTSKVYMISAATMTLVDQFATTIDVVHLVAHPTQPLIYASGQGDAREINVQTGAQRSFSIPAAQASALAIAGDRLFVGGEGGTLGVITLSTGAVDLVGVPECGIYDVVATPDALALLVTCSGNGTAKLLDATTLATITTIATGGVPRRASISADGTKAVIANEDGWYNHVE